MSFYFSTFFKFKTLDWNYIWKQMKWLRKSLQTKLKSEKRSFPGVLFQKAGWWGECVMTGKPQPSSWFPQLPTMELLAADLPWKHILVMHHFQVASLISAAVYRWDAGVGNGVHSKSFPSVITL